MHQYNSTQRILDTKLQATKSVVTDTSGGCGSMFDIYVESPVFSVCQQYYNLWSNRNLRASH